MYKLILVALLAVFANAQSLNFSTGKIEAHTEIFGDSNINPFSENIQSTLSIKEKIDSLKGVIKINTLSLHSNNEKRDEHMYELLNTTLHPQISFEITSLTKIEEFYEIQGVLTLNGVKQVIMSKANILEENNHIILNGDFSINLTSFELKPPKLLFLTVRDRINIKYNLDYIKG
ncbi:YceI family protein [Malaciobacter mytili]|uniref:YceI family protein n=1 Tax=Malaciobacter mytili TaxID=603050 RepID=UPI003A848142